MIKSRAIKWAEALRSGQYKQGTGVLKAEHNGILQHCCLGVACELFVGEPFPLHDYPMALPSEWHKSPAWLARLNGDFMNLTYMHLSDLNDGVNMQSEDGSGPYINQRFSFDEIADLIEAVYVHKVL